MVSAAPYKLAPKMSFFLLSRKCSVALSVLQFVGSFNCRLLARVTAIASQSRERNVICYKNDRLVRVALGGPAFREARD
jgi:hypothetical protein